MYIASYSLLFIILGLNKCPCLFLCVFYLLISIILFNTIMASVAVIYGSTIYIFLFNQCLSPVKLIRKHAKVVIKEAFEYCFKIGQTTRKNCFRYLKLMSSLNAAICTTIYLERQKCYGPGKKILFKKQLFDLEVKGQGPTKVITVCDTPPYGHAPTYQIS